MRNDFFFCFFSRKLEDSVIKSNYLSTIQYFYIGRKTCFTFGKTINVIAQISHIKTFVDSTSNITRKKSQTHI